ncbi:hypothetical protein P6Z40_12630, partial [Enterococcus faecium]|uniref:hypothetical protein n=1 Tax=Enterococcus faecium TaxID=1352 RepID=UPI002891BE7A
IVIPPAIFFYYSTLFDSRFKTLQQNQELQQQLLIQAKSKNDYEDVADEIYHLRELKQNALVENAEREGKRQRIAEMTDFFNEQSCELEEYDEQLVRRLIEKVTVFHDKFAVEFKSGVEIDVEG